MNLLVVIVNYRTAALTVDCLAALATHWPTLAATRVVVTDNCSGDDSPEVIARAVAGRGWGSWCELQCLDRNGGFAFGNNAAIRPALLDAPDRRPDFVLLLNPDTVVRPGALDALLRFLLDHPGVGIAGSRLEEPDGQVQRSAFRFPGVWSEFEHGIRLGPVSRALRRYVVAPPAPAEPCPTGWVAGASMMVRRGVFDAVGLLDEGYFMYYEEVDFCLRAGRAGWPCWYVPASRVVHLVGQASGVTDTKKPRKRRPTYWFDSRRRFFVKNYGRGRALAADAAWLTGYGAHKVRCLLTGRRDHDPPRLWSDFLRNSVLLRGAATPQPR